MGRGGCIGGGRGGGLPHRVGIRWTVPTNHLNYHSANLLMLSRFQRCIYYMHRQLLLLRPRHVTLIARTRARGAHARTHARTQAHTRTRTHPEHGVRPVGRIWEQTAPSHEAMKAERWIRDKCGKYEMSENCKIDGSTHAHPRARGRAHTHTLTWLPSVKRQKAGILRRNKYKDCGGEAGDPKRMIEGVCNATFASLESRALTREHLVQELWLLSNQS